MSEREVENSAAPEAGDELQPSPLPSANKSQPPVWMWIGLGVLAVVALFVVFVLPTIVSEYELPLERRVEAPVSTPSRSEPQGPEVSPFEEAQRANQRKEAQDVLADLLAKQEELEALEVTSWAEEPYQAALGRAANGDEFYRSQEFLQATGAYSEARDELQALLDSVPAVMTATLEEGQQALAAGDSTLAEDKYSLALLFDPESEAAQVGLQRARSLDQVLALLEQAEALAEDDELRQARAVYQQVADLDSYNERARRRIGELDAAITRAEFSRIMSSGYAYLEQGQPDQAIAAFEQAAGLGVNEEQARAAIEQTETELANAQIAAARQRIEEAEASEQWQTAVDEYDAVLAIDPNLSFAVNGRDYAQKRARLDQLLVNAINNPERFADEDVFQETVDVYYTGRDIANPGPRLNDQLDELQTLLENSRVPRQVTLVSDNLTEVTLLRESELGTFEQTTVELIPGRYVALGRRPGYREVRKEFVVGFGQTPDQVVVQCEERVVAVSR